MKKYSLVLVLCSVLLGCGQAGNDSTAKPPEVHNERYSIPQYEAPKTPSKSKY